MGDFEKIENWVNNKKFTIRYGKTDYVDFENKEIVLVSNRDEIKQIYNLLYEYGHLFLGLKKRYKKERFERCLIYSGELDCFNKIKDEMYCWEFGYKLSVRLGLEINKDEYDDFSSKMFGIYISYL